MDQSESESATIDMRLLRVLQHYWSASNKRSRSLNNRQRVVRLIFWLAHPHKDGKVVDFPTRCYSITVLSPTRDTKVKHFCTT